MDKKRICLIAPSLQMGGLERAMSTLANYFVSRGHDVFFVTIFALPPFFILDERIKLSIPPYPFNRQRGKYEFVSYYIKIFSPFGGYLRRTIRQIQPDVIMSFGDVIPQISLISLLGLKIPFYLSNRSSPNIIYSRHFIWFRRLGYFLHRPSGVIAQTSSAAERKRNILGKNVNIQIIPNPVHQITMYDTEKQNWIVSVGRLHHEKGFCRLIEAFSMVNAPDWKLVLAGTGKHEKDIKAKALELRIVDRVIFPGNVENVDKLLCESKIFVLPSFGEGFPNALCEGMAAGLPCISFNIVAGPRDIIKDGINGFLIPDGDLKAMAQKIQYLVDNEAERNRIGSNAKNIVDQFSIEKIGKQYLDFILEKYE